MRSQPGFAHSAPGYYRQQQGHAAILFALFIPILFGIFTLGTDGARAVQDKARLAEAVEVATLAASGSNASLVTDNKRKELVLEYLRYYFPSAAIQEKDIDLNAVEKCEDQSGQPTQNCDDKTSGERFYEYTVSVNVSQPTWFPGNDAIIGFGDDYKVSGAAVARKYQSETLDVIYVADFSGSMGSEMKGTNQIKYQRLVEIIKEINVDLDEFNQELRDKMGENASQNTVAFAGFNPYVAIKSSNTKEKRCKRWGYYYGGYYYRRYYWGEPNYFNSCGGAETKMMYPVDYIDYQRYSPSQTVEKMFERGRRVSNTLPGMHYFYSIPPTSNIKDDFNPAISEFLPDNGTASYQGIINGAQLAMKGKNSRRLIILLSDGMDNSTETTTALVAQGMCTKIINTLKNEVVDGKAVKPRLAMIGFDYPVEENKALKTCMNGEVTEANSYDEIKATIRGLILEEIGHLAP